MQVSLIVSRKTNINAIKRHKVMNIMSFVTYQVVYDISYSGNPTKIYYILIFCGRILRCLHFRTKDTIVAINKIHSPFY